VASGRSQLKNLQEQIHDLICLIHKVGLVHGLKQRSHESTQQTEQLFLVFLVLVGNNLKLQAVSMR
jgi:hypothetical protein